MDCAVVARILPWYLNDSLAGEEHEAVARHLEGCDNCRVELEETRAACEIFAAHLPAAVLTDYATSGSSPDWDSQLIQDHLDGCRTCQAEFLMTRQSCRDLAASTESRGRWRPEWFVIAALLLVCLGLGWQWDKRSGRHQSQPQSGFRSLNVFPVERLLRDTSEAPAVAAGKGIALTLHSQLPASIQTCRINILGDDEIVKWSSTIHRGEDGSFILILPVAFQDTDRITIRLSVGDSFEVAERYHFRLGAD